MSLTITVPVREHAQAGAPLAATGGRMAGRPADVRLTTLGVTVSLGQEDGPPRRLAITFEDLWDALEAALTRPEGGSP